MQKMNFLQLRPEHKDNILYQLGYSEELSLEQLLDVTENDVLNSIPYWMIINRLSKKQLTLLAMEKEITVPENCTRTREALMNIVMSAYDEWDETLNNANCLSDLLDGFPDEEDFSFDFEKGKQDIRQSLRPITPGEEILMMWITTNSTGFCPTLKRFPGPKICKNMITSWLHDTKLLWMQTDDDPRPTRVFTDRDCRTHCLHLRRDANENVLDICKQMGWQPPPVCSDSGSTVYRKSNAIVLSPEYNGSFISWLQLQYEGKISARLGYDWGTAVESARLQYLQMEEKEDLKEKDETKLLEFLKCTIKAHFKDIEKKVDENTDKLDKLSEKIDGGMHATATEIAQALVESLKSANDVDQRILSRFKKKIKLQHKK